MNCNIELHNSFKESGETCCPFCDQQLNQSNLVTPGACCGNQDLIEVDYRILCRSCGQTHNETFAQEWVNFHENRYRIYKKSIYVRKYHVHNVLSDIALQNRLPISRAIIKRVCQKFDVINTVLLKVNKDRRRIISIKFIIHKLF